MAKILASSQVTIMDINEQISLSSRIDCNIAQIQNISNTNTYIPSWSSLSPAILSGVLNRVGLLTDNIITSQDVKSIKWYYKLAAKDNNFIEILTSNPAFELVGTSGKQTQLKIIQNIMTKEYPGLTIRCEIKYQEEWMLSPHLQISDMSFTLSSQGNNGAAGSTGPAGKGISSTVITYQASSSGTTVPTGTWSSTVPTVTSGQYLWTRTILTYTDNTSSTGYSVGKMGEQGPKGDTGNTGKGISSSAITYQASSSGTTVPTGSWGTSVPTVAAGQYLWTRTIISYTDATTSTSYSIGKMGEQGPQGDKGDQGEALEIFDGVFNEGTRFWSTTFNSYISPNNDTVPKSANTSIFGGKTLKITNEVWLYSKNPIPIEDDKIYKFVYRVRQLQNPSDTTKNKVYAGATEFSHDGKKISANNGNYFTASAVSLPVKWKSISGDSAPTNYDPAKDDQYEWTIFEKYMSTSSKTAIIYGTSTKFPAVSAFTSGTKYVKPMCIVNYAAGNGIAEIDCLNVEDVTSQYEAAKESANKINNDSQEIFDKVTDEGVKQGLFSKDGKVYVNSQYINTRNFVARDNSNNMTFAIDDSGNVTIKPTTFSLSPSTSNQTTMVNLLNNNGSSTSDTNGIYLSGGKIYINGENIKADTISTKKLLIGDYSNYCPITPDNCSQFGFKKIVDTTNGDWIQFDTLKRDINLGSNGSSEYSGNIAGTYRVSFTMSSSAKGALNQDGTNINFLTVSIGLFTVNNDGSKGYYVAGSGSYTQADANGSVKKYSTTITIPETAKSFGIYLQHAGWTNFSGVTKLKDVVVNKMMSGSLIVDGAIDGKEITGAVIKSTNGAFLLNDSGINVNNGKFKVDISGNITTAGTVNVGNKFKIDAAGVATMDSITATNLTVNTGIFKGSINVNNKFSVDSSGNLSINGGVFNVNNAGAMSCSNASITGGTLTIGSNFSVSNTGVLTAKSGKIAGYNITGNQLIGSKVGMSGLNGEGLAFWAGHDTPASAPFKVDHAGNLTATNANIKGNITSSNISGSTITSSKVVNTTTYSINLDGAKLTSSTDNSTEVQSVIIEGNSLILEQRYKNSMSSRLRATEITDNGIKIYDPEDPNGTTPAVLLDSFGLLNSGDVAIFNGNTFTKGHIRLPNSVSALQAKDTTGVYRNLAYISGGDSSYFGKGLYDAGIGQTMICGNTMYLRSNDRIYFQIAGNTAAINVNSIEFIPISGNSYFRPTVTDVTRLGSANQLWNIVYSKGGVNTTSDRNSKENIKYIHKDDTCFSSEDMYKFMKNDYLLAQYNYIGDPIEDKKISGVAQDLLVNEDGTDNELGQLIVNCQDAIEMNKEGETPKLSINQTQLLNIAIGALQKTMEKVEVLEQELANLKST